MSKNEKELIIRAHGFGFLYITVILFLFICAGIYVIVSFFISSDPEVYHNILAIIFVPIVTIVCFCELIKWIKVNKVIFRGNEFISPKRSDIKYLGINKNCEDFVGYEIVCSSLLMSMEFKFSDGSTSYFHYITFTKKQILQILNEIQKRGGLKDIEIKLDRY